MQLRRICQIDRYSRSRSATSQAPRAGILGRAHQGARPTRAQRFGWLSSRNLPVAICAILAILVLPTSAHAAFPGANGAIAFSRRSGIWVIQSDGTQLRLAGRRSSQPAWSADGARIAYLHVSHRGNWNIWTMAADGSNKTRVTSSPYYDVSPAWSPDGSRLVFVSSRPGPGGYELYTIRSSPPFGRPQQLTYSTGNENNPVWSPAGDDIAFDVLNCDASGPCGNQVGVVSVDGANYRLLTPQGDVDDIAPDWSPDGTTLLFASNRHEDVPFFDYDIYAISAMGGRVTRMTTAPGDASNGSPVWSPDGARFAFVHVSADARIGGGVITERAVVDGSPSVRLCRGGSLYDSSLDWQAVPPASN